MTFYASLGDKRIIRASVTVPYYGAIVGDCQLALGDDVPSTCTLVIGNASWLVTVVRTGNYAGSRSVRFVGGYGGWRKAVPAKFYQNPSQLLASLVLKDTAAACGENVNLSPDFQIGQFYVRQADLAQRVLRQLAGSLWWVDAAGVTRVASSRPSAAISSAFDVTEWLPGEGRFEVASEDPVNWVPGNTFTAPIVGSAQTISSVTHVLDESTLRTTVLVTK